VKKAVSNKVVLVTGASRRMGREIATSLAEQGWRVALHYRTSEADAQETINLCKTYGLTDDAVASFQADLSSEAQCRSLFQSVIERFGQLDAIINSAALFEFDDGASVTFEMLDAHFKTNTAAPVLLAHLLYQHRKQLVTNDELPAAACVVNLLDQKLWNPNPDFLSYTLSKAALKEAITLQAQAYAPLVRVVGIAPGLTLSSHMMSEEKFEQLHKLALLGQSSDTSDITRAVRFVLESKSITGETILVDGGQHLVRMDRDFSLM
jgi:NAD(P)-dependent dehydrogenase (short-subunit alcohol dehydrogenase family)